MRCLIIIPAYNEAANIEKVVDNLVQNYPQYDYLVINDDLERCAKEMHSIIQGEHDRVSRNADFIDDIRKELKEL